MAKKTVTAPVTAGEAETVATPLQTVGDAFVNLSADQRLKVIGAHLAPEEPEVELEGDGDESAVTDDLSQTEEIVEEAEEPVEEAEEAEAELDEEPVSDEETDDDEHAEKGTPEWLQRRIDKEVGKRKSAEEELAKLREQVAELEAKPAKIDSLPGNVIDSDPEVKEHATKVASLDAALSDVSRLLQEVGSDPDGVVRQLQAANVPIRGEDPETLRDQLRDLRETFREQRQDAKGDLRWSKENAVKKQQESLLKGFHAATVDYPWLQDPKSETRKQAMKVVAENQWIKVMPNGFQVLGAFVEGLQLLEARKAEAKNSLAAKAAGTKKKPVVIPKPKATPVQQRVQSDSITSEQREKALLGGDPQLRRKIISQMMKPS